MDSATENFYDDVWTDKYSNVNAWIEAEIEKALDAIDHVAAECVEWSDDNNLVLQLDTGGFIEWICYVQDVPDGKGGDKLLVNNALRLDYGTDLVDKQEQTDILDVVMRGAKVTIEIANIILSSPLFRKLEEHKANKTVPVIDNE